jgi:hypothetical protein
MTQAKAFCKKRTQANTKRRVLSGLKICNLFIYNILNAFLDANTPHPVFVFIRIFLINNMLICSLPLKEPAGQIRCDTTRTPSPPAMGQTEHNGTLPGGGDSNIKERQRNPIKLSRSSIKEKIKSPHHNQHFFPSHESPPWTYYKVLPMYPVYLLPMLPVQTD